jgi:hypothetical protein
MDQGIEHQRNLTGRNIIILFWVKSNRLEDLLPHIAARLIHLEVNQARSGSEPCLVFFLAAQSSPLASQHCLQRAVTITTASICATGPLQVSHFMPASECLRWFHCTPGRAL